MVAHAAHEIQNDSTLIDETARTGQEHGRHVDQNHQAVRAHQIPEHGQNDRRPVLAVVLRHPSRDIRPPVPGIGRERRELPFLVEAAPAGLDQLLDRHVRCTIPVGINQEDRGRYERLERTDHAGQKPAVTPHDSSCINGVDSERPTILRGDLATDGIVIEMTEHVVEFAFHSDVVRLEDWKAPEPGDALPPGLIITARS